MTAVALQPNGGIDLWLTDYAQVTDELLLTEYRRLLNAEEKRQEPRFYFAKDRVRYLVTRALVRTVLSRYAPVRPEHWRFSKNEYGRPAIANEEAMPLQLSFNISHTHSLIVLGVTRQRALGVDVENFSTREAPVELADRYFAPDEVADLAALPASEQPYRFFEYWTFKESYIKARGMGLSLPLDKFSFRYRAAHTVDIAIHPELTDDPARWEFWQFLSADQYLIAVCAERVNDICTPVVVREVIPMHSEQRLQPMFSRTSGADYSP